MVTMFDSSQNLPLLSPRNQCVELSMECGTNGKPLGNAQECLLAIILTILLSVSSSSSFHPFRTAKTENALSNWQNCAAVGRLASNLLN